jgi:hypothetical protein
MTFLNTSHRTVVASAPVHHTTAAVKPVKIWRVRELHQTREISEGEYRFGSCFMMMSRISGNHVLGSCMMKKKRQARCQARSRDHTIFPRSHRATSIEQPITVNRYLQSACSSDFDRLIPADLHTSHSHVLVQVPPDTSPVARLPCHTPGRSTIHTATP